MHLLRLLAGSAALLWASAAFSLDLDPGEIRGKSSKEPVDVLQNRYFLKSWRPELGLIAGTMLDEAYISTRITGVRLGLFFNEWLGAEVQSQRTTVTSSTDRKALNKLRFRPYNPNGPIDNTVIVTPDPEVNAIHQVIDVNAIVAPFYGKLNVLNLALSYTDIYATGGIAMLDTDQGAKTAVSLGAGERFYIGKAWSVRVDFKDRIFNETRAGATSRRNAKSIDFGVGYFFN